MNIDIFGYVGIARMSKNAYKNIEIHPFCMSVFPY